MPNMGAKKTKKIVVKVEEPAVAPAENESSPEPFQLSMRHRVCILFLFIFGMGVVSLHRVFSFEEHHTLKQIKCHVHNNVATCGDEIYKSGTFIVEMSKECATSIYEVSGFPFTVAMQPGKNIFKVPASGGRNTVKSVSANCRVNAFIDSNSISVTSPFTWVTTEQHNYFTLKNGKDILAFKVSSSLFTSEKNGRWVAYTFDVPKEAEKISVTGDGTDIIHVYGVHV